MQFRSLCMYICMYKVIRSWMFMLTFCTRKLSYIGHRILFQQLECRFMFDMNISKSLLYLFMLLNIMARNNNIHFLNKWTAFI